VPHTVPAARPIFVAVLLAASFAARPATAQDASSLVAEDLFIGVQHPVNKNLGDPEVLRFFNKANCDCSEPVFLYFAPNESGVAKLDMVPRTGQMEFWVGSGCDDVSLRQTRCVLLASSPLAKFLDDGHLAVETTARMLSTQPGTGAAFPADGNPTCTSTVASFTQGIYALIDTDGDGIPEVSAKRLVLIDLNPPPAPIAEGISTASGNEAVVVRWPKIDSSLYPDLRGYQILCNRGGELQVFKEGSFDPFLQSCPATVSAAGGGIAALDPLFVCSPLLSPSTTSYRIKILQNDIVYGVGVLAIDESGNASPPSEIVYGTPGATDSFYDIYRTPKMDDPGPPGAAEGGFCAVAPPSSGRPTLGAMLALVVTGLVLGARRRRR
jgi:hypothetical protein